MVCVLVEDWETVSSYSHAVGVRKVFPDLNGTRLVFIDDKNAGFLLSPSSVRTQVTKRVINQSNFICIALFILKKMQHNVHKRKRSTYCPLVH